MGAEFLSVSCNISVYNPSVAYITLKTSGETLAVDLNEHWWTEFSLGTIFHEPFEPLLDRVLVISSVCLQELHVSFGQFLLAGLISHLKVSLL